METMDGFSRRKEQSKKEIRQAAWALFGQFGVDKVSVADIARRAGVSPATIYNRFGSKDALAQEFVAAMIEQLEDQIRGVLAPDRPFELKIAAVFQFIADTMSSAGSADEDAVARTVFTGNLDLARNHEIRRIRDAAQERMVALLLKAVQEGREQGRVNPALSQEALRIYFCAFMEALVDPRLQHRLAREPRLVQELGTLMLTGLGI
jgi:AcrR family transcriptional regulator